MALLGTSGRASWKVVHWNGKKYEQSGDILELYKNVQEDEEEAVKDQGIMTLGKCYLVMDSCIIHDQAKIKKIEQITGAKILFLPQFSRELNPL